MTIKQAISYYFFMKIVPHLYFFVIWLCLSALAILFVGDVWRGMGMASAYSLYMITNMMYSHEYRGGNRDQSYENQGS